MTEIVAESSNKLDNSNDSGPWYEGTHGERIAVPVSSLDTNGALSDDPDELQNELQALAGPSAGPGGGQIYIDGFTGGTRFAMRRAISRSRFSTVVVVFPMQC